MFELDNIKEGNPLRKRLEDAIDAMKEDYTSVIAEDEVGPCTPHLEEQAVIIREYNSALFESCYAITGSEADYRSNARAAPARPTIVLNDRHPSFVTLMEILDWRSRAANSHRS